MNAKLPKLAAALLAVLLALGVYHFAPTAEGEENAVNRIPELSYSDPATADASQRAARGEAILQAALDTVVQQRSISARLRQQVQLYGHQLAGPGIYLQQGTGQDRKFRLDMSIRLAQQTSTSSQVSDGRFLWLFEDFGVTPELKIVDLRRVRDEIKQAQPLPPAAIGASSLAFGGLPRLLASLQENFQFVPANETYLGNVAVWELHGSWRPAGLARVLPAQAEAILAGGKADVSALPPHVPHQVVLYVGRDDRFPYRLEYRWRPVSAESEAAPSFVLLELFEVKLGVPLDASQFGKPANAPEVDFTGPFMEQLGIVPKKNPNAP